MATNNTIGNVTTGKPKVSGAVYRAPLGSTLPTDSTTDLDAAFICLGYISEDGVTNSKSWDSNGVHAWGGDTVLNTESNHEDTFSFTMIEATNAEVLKTAYNDDNVEVSDAGMITVHVNSDEHDGAVYVIDTLLTNGGTKRMVIPEGKITSLGEITYNDTDPTGYNITLSCMPHADWDGDTHREYIAPASTTTTTTTTSGD